MISSPLSETYNPFAIVLHWLMAVAIVGIFSLGLYMADLPFSPSKLQYYSWHKWGGVTIFLFAVLRLAWRLTHSVPSMPSDTPIWQRRAAVTVHWLFYFLMFVVPLSGWLMSSAKGVPTVYFGLWRLPDLIGKDRELGLQLENLHGLLNYTMATLVVIHIGAAFKHYFMDRDGVLQRMVPFVKDKAHYPETE